MTAPIITTILIGDGIAEALGITAHGGLESRAGSPFPGRPTHPSKGIGISLAIMPGLVFLCPSLRSHQQARPHKPDHREWCGNRATTEASA
jgi:hypothetical protein